MGHLERVYSSEDVCVGHHPSARSSVRDRDPEAMNVVAVHELGRLLDGRVYRHHQRLTIPTSSLKVVENIEKLFHGLRVEQSDGGAFHATEIRCGEGGHDESC
jgi:hypothetical protein